jgi:hypothetical protein
MDPALLLQKRMEVDALRRQLMVETEISRLCQQNMPLPRRPAPPGYGQPSSSHVQAVAEETHYDGPGPVEQPSHSQHNPWHKYTKDYEHEMRTQFLKNITKGPRLDFPKFDGDNPVEWIRQCEKCFQMSATPEEYKFSLAQLYIVGRADVWLRRSKILKNNPPWPKFCEMLLQRFSSHSSYQLVESFNTLKQNNLTVTEYADLFEELMATVTEENPELSESWFVRCFVNGLRDGIKYQLRPLRPKTLTDAFWLAKDMEHSHPPKKVYTAYVPPFQRFNTQATPPPVRALPAPPVVPKLEYPQPANQQPPRARKLGECWRCGDKWIPGHRCTKVPTVHAMREDIADPTEEEIQQEELQQMENLEHSPEHLMAISCQALDTSLPTSTPCVLISVGGKRTVALLDSGSTSTFIDLKFAIKANCTLLPAPPHYCPCCRWW